MLETSISVFISYARLDTAFVDRLEADLQAHNFRTWVDRRKLEGGQQWLDEIQNAIDRCQVLLVVLSPEAAESRYVKMEYRYARDEHKPVIPLQYRSGPKVPMDLRYVQRIDFEGDYDQGLEILLKALSRIEIPLSTIQKPLPIEMQEVLNIEASSPNSSDYGTKDKQHNAGFDYHIGSSPSIRPIIPSHKDEEPVLFPEDFNQAQNVRETTTNMQKSDADIMMPPQAVSSEATRQIRDKFSTPYDPFNPFAYLEDAQSVPLPEQQASVSMDEIADKVSDIADYPVRIDGIHIEDEGDLGDIADFSDSSSPSFAMLTEEQDIQRPSRIHGVRPRMNRTGKVLPSVPPQSLGHQSGLTSSIGGVSNHSPHSVPIPRPSNQPRSRAAQPSLKKRPTSSRTGSGAAPGKRGIQTEVPRLAPRTVSKKEETRREFIEKELETIPFVVWCCAFVLRSGLGFTVGILTKSWQWAVVTVAIITLLAYIFGHRKAVHPLVMLGIAFISSTVDYYLTRYAVSTFLLDSKPRIFSFWIFNNLHLWVGRQVNFGLIIGAVAAFFCFFYFAEDDLNSGLIGGIIVGAFIGLIAWFVVATIASIFNWGFGFGYDWNISLLAGAVGIVGGTGLAASCFIWFIGLES